MRLPRRPCLIHDKGHEDWDEYASCILFQVAAEKMLPFSNFEVKK